VTTAVLRIVKEGVANALRHASPTTITIRLTYEPRAVRIEICDDGHGVDSAWLESATSRGHWGIAGMRERARAAGGTVVVATAPGEGTRVELVVPA
jgi:signal transduction histidine kinase